MEQKIVNKDLPDVQGTAINGKKINKVGIRETYGEIIFNNKTIPANFSLYVSLIGDKGIHMSRLPQTLLDLSPLEIKKDAFENLLNELEKRSGEFCKDFYVKTGFDYAREIFSPVTKLKNIMLIPVKIKVNKVNNHYKHILEINVPYTSSCPCSKNISKNSAHNQRSNATITVELNNLDYFALVDKLIKIVEFSSSCPIYNLLKREDEKYVTEKAYENSKFVEDVSREIAEKLDKLLDEDITDYSIVINHEESIHQHNAVAFITAGKNLK
jgi:GTP cyclohydrolase I